jgi:ribulose 1,5-bisphosphate synthetase/thiazole synthase
MVFRTLKQKIPSWNRPTKELDTNAVPDAATTEETIQQQHNQQPTQPTAAESVDVVIAGAGIVGLVLALAFAKQGIAPVHVFEQAAAFHDDVGAGMGMYPNGLRVIRDISPDLLRKVQEAGYPYKYRRWMVSVVGCDWK